MTVVTFDTLPLQVQQLHEKIDNLEKLLIQKNETSLSEQHLDLQELCDYLPQRPTKATVYGWIHARKIPFHKPVGSKKLYFLKSEIDDFLKSGRVETRLEVIKEKGGVYP